MTLSTIHAANTRRVERIPPGSRQVWSWPDDEAIPPPLFDPAAWDITAFPMPLVRVTMAFPWAEFAAWPRVRVFADIHSDSGWSLLDNLWEGVSTAEFLRRVPVKPEAKFVVVHGEYGMQSAMTLAEFAAEEALFALVHNGKPLSLKLGFPVRLIVPEGGAKKCLRWVRGVEFRDRGE